MTCVAALAIAAAMVVGQAENAAKPLDGPSAYEHLRELEYLIGEHVGQYTIPEGWEDFGPRGAKVVRRLSVRWALNKSILIAQIKTAVEGKPEVTSMELAAWDPKSKQIVHWIFSPGGGLGSGVWSKEGDELLLKWSSVTPDKVTYSGTSRMRRTGPNTSTWEIVDCSKDGEKIANLPLVKFKPVYTARDEQAAAVPKEVLEEFKYFIGQWKMTGKEGAKTYASEYVWRWVPGKYSVTFNSVWSGAWEGRGTGLVGWDGVNEEIVSMETYDDGSVCQLRYKREAPGVWAGTTSNTQAGQGTYKAKIAEHLGTSLRGVERKLRLIRQIWEKEEQP